MIRVPVGRTWKLTAFLLQVSRLRCAHCGLVYCELGIAQRVSQVKGEAFVSLFRSGDVPRQVLSELEDQIGAVEQPIRSEHRRCPGCRRGDSRARRSTKQAERIAGIVGSFAVGAPAILLLVKSSIDPWLGLGLAFLAVVTGGVVANFIFDSGQPMPTDPWPVNRVIPDAMTQEAFAARVRAVGRVEATRAWAREARLYDPDLETTQGHVVLVLPPYDAAPFVPSLGTSPVATPVGQAPLGVPAARYPAPATADTMACPRCAETVKRAALVCRFCGYELAPPPPSAPPGPTTG